MRRIIATTALLTVAAGVTAGVTAAAPPPDTAALLADPWEPDPFPLGVCFHGPELGDDPQCVLVDPGEG